MTVRLPDSFSRLSEPEDKHIKPTESQGHIGELPEGIFHIKKRHASRKCYVTNHPAIPVTCAFKFLIKTINVLQNSGV